MTSMIELFSNFDLIRIVNLPERADRRRDMNAELRLLGLEGDPRVQFFSAIRTANAGLFRRVGSHGALLSHLELLREAAQKESSILILQDDCEFLLPELQKCRLPSHWDIFYGGFSASDESSPKDSEIIGAHCMGFSPSAAKIATTYLDRYLRPDFQPDPQAAKAPGFDPSIRPPIDGALVWMRRAHPELTTVFERVSVQRASRSDVAELKFFDRLPLFRTLATGTRRFRNRFLGKKGMKQRNVVFSSLTTTKPADDVD